MAVTDILAEVGDGQDFIVEIPVGNAGYVPSDSLVEGGESPLCAEVPVIVAGGGGGGNIFIMSE